MFGRATIRLGIGPHSSLTYTDEHYFVCNQIMYTVEVCYVVLAETGMK